MAASAFNAGEFAIDQKDAKAIAEAIVDVAEQYPVTIDPKAMAWGKLGLVLVSVYGGRALIYRTRKKAERQQRTEVQTPIQQAAKDNPMAAQNFVPGSGKMPE